MTLFVYRNLHLNTYSLRDTKTRLVVEHADYLILKDTKFKVSEAGRQRVLREKRKNVHAGIVGERCSKIPENYKAVFRVTYDPYRYDSFINCFTFEPVYEANYVELTPRGVYVWF